MLTSDICRLCRNVKRLKKSHIIPEFLYKTLYDEKHRFNVLSTHAKNKMQQKGIYEKLLCEDCELKLSKWEHYASQILNGGTEIITQRIGNRLHLSEIDYLKFRLFQLSILWRASISSRHFFQNVQLDEHEEIIRELLLSDDPGHSWQYGCLMTAITYKDAGVDQILTDLMSSPEKSKKDGQTIYHFIFGGLIWMYLVSRHKPPPQVSPGLLSPEGNLVILIRNVDNLNLLKDIATDIYSVCKR